MKTYPIFLSVACSICFALVSALPNLVAREGGCESVVCWPDFSDDFGIGSSFGALWQLFRGGPLLPGAPPDDTKTNWNAPGRVPGPEQSPIETYVIARPDECDAAQASDPQAFSGDTGPSTCEAATRLLVWPRDCTDEGENTRIDEILRRMYPKTLTSTDSLCQLTDEVSFWITKISQENVESLRQQFPGTVVTLNTLRKKMYGGTTSRNSKPIQIPAANEKSHLKKHALLTVEKQELNKIQV